MKASATSGEVRAGGPVYQQTWQPGVQSETVRQL